MADPDGPGRRVSFGDSCGREPVADIPVSVLIRQWWRGDGAVVSSFVARSWRDREYVERLRRGGADRTPDHRACEEFLVESLGDLPSARRRLALAALYSALADVDK